MIPLSILLNDDSGKSYLNLFRLSPQPMWVYNVDDLRFLDVNDAAVKHYGFSREEFLHMTLLDIRPEEDKQVFEEALEVIRDEKPELTSKIYRHKKKNGEVIHVQILSNAIDFKNINARLILVNDITSIIRSEKEVQASKEELLKNSMELKLSNERYKLVLKASDEAICDWDIENDIVDWGSGFHDIFGYDLTVYNNNLWSDNIHPDDQQRILKEVVAAIADKNKEIYYSEYRFLKANREVIHIQHRGIFLRDATGKAIRSVDTLKDITAHKQRLEHIEKQNEQLRQIAWTQSHNVRDPLARIMALADLLKAEEFVSETQQDILEHLIQSAADLDEAIRAVIKKTL